jgi:hypothetical protein
LNNTCSIIYNLFKSMWKRVFIVVDVLFNLEVLKKKPTKSKWIMTHVKAFKNIFFETRKLKKKIIATHMDLWKYSQILTIQKFLNIKWLKFTNKKFFIWIYHCLLHHILSPNNEFGMWINKKKSILWRSN